MLAAASMLRSPLPYPPPPPPPPPPVAIVPIYVQPARLRFPPYPPPPPSPPPPVVPAPLSHAKMVRGATMMLGGLLALLGAAVLFVRGFRSKHVTRHAKKQRARAIAAAEEHMRDPELLPPVRPEDVRRRPSLSSANRNRQRLQMAVAYVLSMRGRPSSMRGACGACLHT